MDPENSRIKRALADDMLRSERFDDALKLYAEIAAADPRDAQIQLRLSEIYRQKGDFAKARAAFNKAHEIDPDSLEVRYEEVNLLGGPPRNPVTNSREFDDTSRYLRSLAGPTRSQLPATGTRQPISGGLRIVSARYGAGDKFIDVRDRVQSRVKNDQLDLLINNSSMGGDPNKNRSEQLRLRYEWAGRQFDLIVAEDQWATLPTEQQIKEGTIETGSTIDYPSRRFVNVENAMLHIGYPDNWETHGQGDAMTITPKGGLVNDGQGNQALAHGVIVNIFEPGGDGYGQQLQSRGYEQTSSQNAATHLEEATDRLVQELRLSNRNMRVIRNREALQVDGARALSQLLVEVDGADGLARPLGQLADAERLFERDHGGIRLLHCSLAPLLAPLRTSYVN
jgi:tetratricopeptide (TPR) repeat protein